MNWSIWKSKKLPWPDNEAGEPVPPAFLKCVYGGPLDTELTINLLEAYGIPHVTEYPRNGLIGKLFMGQSSSGVEVYVPETLLEDAQNIINADIGDEPDESDEFDGFETDATDE